MFAHLGDSHTLVSISHSIGWGGVPTAELYDRIQRTHARVIEDRLVHVRINRVQSFYINSHDTAVNLMEVNLQTGTGTALRHDIHGERTCGEGDLAIYRSDGGHEIKAIGSFVIDIQLHAVIEISIRDGHHNRLVSLGLPNLVAILDSDVIGTLHLLALYGRALHLGHRDLGGLRHLARHSNVRCGHLFGNRTVCNRTLILRHQG